MSTPTGSKPVGITLELHEVYKAPEININDLKLPTYLHTDKEWAPKLKNKGYTVSHGGMLSEGLGNGYRFSTKSVDKKPPTAKENLRSLTAKARLPKHLKT